MTGLNTDIKYLPGIGPKKAEVLQKELQIIKLEDLLYHFPYKYIDRTKFYKIREINKDLPSIQLKGKIKGYKVAGEKFKKRLIAEFYDDTGTIELVWFKGVEWIKNNIKINTEYIVFGKPTLFIRKINIPHPEIEPVAQTVREIKSTLQAEYNTTEKMKKNYLNSRAIHKLMQNAFKQIKIIPETLPQYFIEKYKLMPLQEALLNIHFPTNDVKLQKARYRLKFDELFYIQLQILSKRNKQKRSFKGYVFEKVGDYFNQFYKEKLPFELTNAQKRVIREIRHDLGSGKHTNRLLQGDVGSGKTLVALMNMLIALDNNFQACLMAPTEILATQHFHTICNFLEGLNIQVKLLTGSTRKKARTTIHEELLSGNLQILIGTHALIEDVVQFKNLGLVIIDEQHRFGVAQRAKLWGKNTNPPHVIVMTATPIPRTLSMTLYGDLDISVIDELPPGRKPIKTSHAYDAQRLRIFGFIRKQIAEGRQIYIVYPLIQESEIMDYKDLEDGYESISRAFPAPEYAISIVHGRMKAAEKEKAMQLFVKKQTQIMIATTVIEVGVNVPNATTMIIESAERFGLSQLHQLRGRVGRGGEQSYCILMTSYKLSKDAKTRIQTMVETNDGFKIAEVDMKLRGPGDIEGTQQSGIPFDFKIANLAQDTQILQHARTIAQDLLNKDPQLTNSEHVICKMQIDKLKKNKLNWRIIS